MEVIWEIHLNTWHTPNYTHTPDERPAHIADPNHTTEALNSGEDYPHSSLMRVIPRTRSRVDEACWGLSGPQLRNVST